MGVIMLDKDAGFATTSKMCANSLTDITSNLQSKIDSNKTEVQKLKTRSNREEKQISKIKKSLAKLEEAEKNDYNELSIEVGVLKTDVPYKINKVEERMDIEFEKLRKEIKKISYALYIVSVLTVVFAILWILKLLLIL